MTGATDTGPLATTTDRRLLTGEPVAAFARGPVLALAGIVALLLTAVSGRYGYFGDELYFVAAGHHLDWGYADQPPLVPLLALLMDTIAPGSVAVLRIPATLATVAGIVLAALLARELGGGRRAQLITAGAFALAPIFLGGGHLLATSTFDPVLWTAVTWLVVRWVRTRSDRLLLVAGVVTAVALQVKFLIVGFWVIAILAVLVVGPRGMLRRPALWAGGAIAVLATVPTLLWQANNGWPQLAMSQAVAAESVYAGGVLGFLPLGLAGGFVIGLVLALHGTYRLLRDPDLRFLGITALGVAALFMATGGRPYYISGMFALVWAASAVTVERGDAARWWRWVATWPVYAVSAVVVLAVIHPLPIKPVSWHADQPLQIGNFQLDEIGWENTVPDVVAAFDALPDDVARNAVVVTGDYWSVSAAQRYAPQLPSYSYHRGAAWFGTPPEDSGSVLFLGDPTALAPYFTSVTMVGAVDNDLRVTNLTQGGPILLLEGRTAPWSQIWPAVRHL
ncbi:glycosyltransferase family 39 protein [Pseudonocardia lacus]|uniref:glycosyltransferase family 39 protein n=1 Tax=Pseudonocardia lacus TaxID=2835865 RepID=UPI001BDCCCC4|nr:glycosyltransferase family 39 protein [Pseudonocardia lacus]